MEWYTGVLKKYAVFEGRASRREFWMFTLINILVVFVIGFLESLVNFPPLLLISAVYSLAVFIPGLAVVVRRLHDTDKSGWLLLLVFIPFVGSIILLIMCIFEGTPGSNKFGPSVSAVSASPVTTPSADTSIHQSEPEVKETRQVADDVVINDVQSSEPIPSTTEADTIGGSDSSADSSSF